MFKDRYSAIATILLPSLAVVAVAVGGLAFGSYWHLVLSITINAMIAGLALTMLVGYARCITLASGAMMAIGAYGSAVMVLHLGMSFPFAVLAALAFGSLAGWILAVPAVRFRSHNLAMVTLVFQAVVIILLREAKALTGGAEGLHIPAPTLFGITITTDIGKLLLTGVAAIAAVLPLTVLLYGPFGKNLRALSANEIGARAFGINVRTHIIGAFVISSAAIAFSGALSAPLFRIIDPDSYGVLASIHMLAYPIIGGMSSLWGGLLGAGVLRMLPELLRPVAAYIELIFCSLVVITVMFYPGGLVQLVQRISGKIRARVKEPVAAAAQATDAAAARNAVIVSMVAVHGARRAAPTGEIALRVEGMSKSYGALQAVRDVRFKVVAGQLHGLMGPNGAGKTTLFNMMTGFTAPDSGRVFSFDADIGDVPVEQRVGLGITRTFQHVAVFPTLSCFDNVLIGLGRNGMSAVFRRSFDAAVAGQRTQEEARAVMAALDAVGLRHLAMQRAGSLSLGNQRRLEIARAIVSRPRMILLDEPVSGVGLEEAAGLRELLRTINRELGVTMIVIEHNIGFLLALCDRLTVMSHGQIIAEGDPEEVVAMQSVRSAYFGEKVAA
jgi:branched-chain amino acid transport system permease protein